MDYLIGHLIGDYLLQNDWMALGKKKSHWPCLVHVAIYTVCVMILTRWPLWAAAVVFVPHYLIDRWQFVPWYMRRVGQVRFMECSGLDRTWQGGNLIDVSFNVRLGPWSMIVVDNVMHLVCLYATQFAVELSK
jgi:hypothetical protein